MGLATLRRALEAAMPPSTQSPKGEIEGLGDADTGSTRQWVLFLPRVKTGERPVLGTYRKGVTSARHVGF